MKLTTVTVLLVAMISSASAMDVNKMLSMVNQERQKAGKSPLKLDSCLVKSAQNHSNQQGRAKSMSHQLPGEQGLSDRIDAVCPGRHWNGWAENVAAGQTSEQQCMKDWMNSPGHRANILGDYTHFGAAVADTSGQSYWTQNFAKGNGQSSDSAPSPGPSPAPSPAPSPGPDVDEHSDTDDTSAPDTNGGSGDNSVPAPDNSTSTPGNGTSTPGNSTSTPGNGTSNSTSTSDNSPSVPDNSTPTPGSGTPGKNCDRGAGSSSDGHQNGHRRGGRRGGGGSHHHRSHHRGNGNGKNNTQSTSPPPSSSGGEGNYGANVNSY